MKTPEYILKKSENLKFLLKDTFLYGSANALTRAVSLITFPLLARYFSVSDYGLIDLFLVFSSFLTLTLVFGQDSAVARYYYEYKDEVNRKNLISESLLIQIILLIVVLPLLWIFSNKISLLLSDSSTADLILKLNIIQVPLLVFQNFARNILKWTFSRVKFLILSVGLVFSYMLLLVLGVYVFKINVEGVFIILLINNFLFGIIGFIFIKNWLVIPKKINFSYELLKYAAPYGIICCIGSFVPTLERSIVNSILGSEELGLYAAGSKVAMLVTIVVQAFQTAWGPFSLSIYKEEDAIKTYNIVLKVYTFIIFTFVFILSLVAEPLLNFLASSKYEGASVVVLPLSIGLAIQSIAWITELGVIISKKSHLKIYQYIVYFVSSFLGIYYLGSKYGLEGVAIGLLLGHFLSTIYITYLSQKSFHFDWEFKRLITFVIFTSLILLLLRSLNINNLKEVYSVILVILVYLLISLRILFRNSELKKIFLIITTRFFIKT